MTVVVTGAGGIGTAVVGVLADRDEPIVLADLAIERAAAVSGVVPAAVDVASRASVTALAELAADLGPITTLVHTAGVSPVQAPVSAIVEVDLVGTAHVLEVFGAVVAPGGSGVVVASLAGHLFAPHLTADQATALGGLPADELPSVLAHLDERATAYGWAKRGNQVRVAAQAVAWGRRGVRLNSVSPGLIDTEMGRAERASPDGVVMDLLVEGSALQRIGTPSEIAQVVAFLLSPAAAYVTGTDVLVDGGVLASLTPHSGRT